MGASRRVSLSSLFSRVKPTGRTPSRDASTREAALATQVALSRLQDDRRRAIHMRYIEGRPPREIAAILGKSSAAVNGLLFHGLRELRERLGDACRFFSDAQSSEHIAR